MLHAKGWWLGAVLATAGCVLAADAVAARDVHAAAPSAPGYRVPAPTPYTEWPAIRRRFPADPALEARVRKIVASMSLAQKIGQMTQAEIKSITPAQVTRYYIGSVLNGGGSWPAGNKHAGIGDWLALSDAYYAASMATDAAVKVPIIWGTDAVHGDNNVFGATLFPHTTSAASPT